MRRTSDLVSLQEFPQDRVFRKIVGFGPVTRLASIDGGVVWPVILKTTGVSPHDFEEAQTVSCNISSALLPFLKLGSIWQGQDLISSMSDGKKFEGVELDPDSHGIFRRFDCEESGLPRFFQDGEYLDCPPHVAVTISGLGDVRLALVRCSELARFYFGQSSLLAQEMINFDAEGRNDRLYDFDQSHWVGNSGHYLLSLKKLVEEKDGRYLAMQLAWEPTFDALMYLSRSVRTSFAGGNEAWPKMYLPFSSKNTWNVLGQVRPIQLTDDDGIVHCEKMLAITQISYCSMNRRIETLQLKMPRNLSKKTTNLDRFPTSTVSPPNQQIPWTSMELPGVSIRHSVKVVINVFEGCPGMGVENCIVSLDDEIENEIGPQHVSAQNVVDALSAVEGGTGQSNVGDLSIVPDVPSQVRETQTNESEEELIDRADLPNIFDQPFPDSPIECLTPYTDIPPEFVPTLHAAAKVQGNWGHAVATSYNGVHLTEDFESVGLFEIPEAWGKVALNDKAPNGARRVLCIKMQSEFGQSFILDIERVSPHDKFGIYLVHFPERNIIPMALLGRFYHWRLFSSRCWPDRTTHNGDFLVRRIRHDFGLHAKIRMECRLGDNIGAIFETLEQVG